MLENTMEEDQFHGKDWLYFFIHGDEYFYGERKKTRVVGNELGFWSSVGEEDPIYNTDGNIFAFKTYFIYFSGSLAKAKKTQWKMEEFRLPLKFQTKELEVTLLSHVFKI
ncbi:hypothetical protein HYC85_004910 [Camellia sinensis]|uniref:NAC domain-containing protein n=1 Tax=Camellia sinensis TaxID=4442 RepID=A0A7J7HYX6_CAMSI|nr:hypothetical protein HYC85_004910 [Camellia sinensis]